MESEILHDGFQGFFPEQFGHSGSLASYGFTLSGSPAAVTGMDLMIGSHTFTLNIPANASFSVSTGSVTESLTNAHSTESIIYTQVGTTSAYQVTSETHTITTPTTTTFNGNTLGFSFTITGTVVTAPQTVFTHGATTITHDLRMLPDGTLTLNADGTITETTVSGHAVESTTFVQPTANGLYAVQSVSTGFIQPGTATTLLDVEAEDHLNLTFSNDAVTQVQFISPSGATHTVTPGSHVSFQEVTAGDTSLVEKITTFGTNSHFELYLQSTANGTYTEIAHGAGTTIDVVGIHAQLAQLPAANVALI